MDEMMFDIKLIKNALQNSSHGEVAIKMKIPNPMSFNGTQSAKVLKNFLWDMEQFFKATRVPEMEVSITSMYVDGDAKL